jgi:hypothetical protein
MDPNLVKAFNDGVQAERERIIKHLEATKHHGYPNIQVKLLFDELRWFMNENGEGND